MRAFATCLAAALVGIVLAGCTVRGGGWGESPYDARGYAQPWPYDYAPSPFAYRYPYRRFDDDRYADRDPLSRRQVLNRLDRQGYSDFGDFDRRRGAYFVEARDGKGRFVVLKVNKYTGRVIDVARE